MKILFLFKILSKYKLNKQKKPCKKLKIFYKKGNFILKFAKIKIIYFFANIKTKK